MNIAEIAVSAAVQGAVGMLIWMLVKRQIEHQDSRLVKQEQEIQDLRDDKLAVLRKSVEACVPRAEFDLTVTNLDKRMEAGSAIHKELRADVGFIKEQLAGISKTIELMWKQVRVSFPSGSGS